jgi:hypothetical protein
MQCQQTLNLEFFGGKKSTCSFVSRVKNFKNHYKFAHRFDKKGLIVSCVYFRSRMNHSLRFLNEGLINK